MRRGRVVWYLHFVLCGQYFVTPYQLDLGVEIISRVEVFFKVESFFLGEIEIFRGGGGNFFSRGDDIFFDKVDVV